MKTHTKILAGVGALACVAIVYGQSYGAGQARQRQGGGEVRSANGDLYRAASSTVGGYKAEPMTVMQGVLSRHMVNIQNHLIEKYNNEKVTSEVILGHCESQLLLRTPNQQKHELFDVWDIDVWKPGPKWDAMVDTPSLVNELLRVDPKVEKEIAALENRLWDEFMKPMQDFIKREGLADMPKDEAQRRLQAWNQQHYAGVTMVERSRRAVERSQKVIDFARTKLTQQQAAEMDKILGLFSEKMAVVEANAKKD